jgi:hypothetical protein
MAKPAPLFYGSALESVSTVAAPLLAGFSLAAAVALGADAEKFRWSGGAMLSLTIAAVLLVSAVQCGFTARRHFYSAADVKDWRPDAQEDSDRELKLRERQQEDFKRLVYLVRLDAACL